MSKDKELAIAYVSSKGRICPNPQEWMALSEIIGMNGPGRKLVPLILAGWAFTSDAQKRATPVVASPVVATLPASAAHAASDD